MTSLGGLLANPALVRAIAAASDTVVNVEARSGFDEFLHLVNGLLSVVLLGAVFGLAVIVLEFRKAQKKIVDTVTGLRSDLQPVLRKTGEIADDAKHISAMVRERADRIGETIDEANGQVREVLHSSQQRLAELGALLDVMQREVERLFVSGAAVMRGVERGAARLVDRDGPEFASVESDADLATDDLDFGEQENGDHERFPSDGATHVGAPRVRTQTRHDHVRRGEEPR